ncbi:MAG: hypothetical protein NT132_03580 [Microbacterium sp.]|uniref:hypothetical protein n=1 Tax=Microbacterium sp. TaxID=51671 RepID=UPI00262E7FCD|nr:hypothetical protein [Microbacterium sp.]MCX6501478.1 hypothetical protein [Microbacterium sp.]
MSPPPCNDAIPPGERAELPADLWRRGNRAELHVWSGGFHAFDCAVEDASVSEESHRVRGEWIRRWLAGEV